jgi:ATP sulfurylase
VPDRLVEAEKVYYFTSEEHPAVFHLLREKKKYNIGGRVWAISLPKRSWVECKTPAQVCEFAPSVRNPGGPALLSGAPVRPWVNAFL